MKKIAILIGGWHYPKGFYNQLSRLNCPDGFEFETFVVSHRDVDLPIVHQEKLEILSKIDKNTEDELDVVKGYNYIIAEKETLMSNSIDVERYNYIQKIKCKSSP